MSRCPGPARHGSQQFLVILAAESQRGHGDAPAFLLGHLAWASEEANQVIRKSIVEDVDRFIRGEGPRCWVNKPK